MSSRKIGVSVSALGVELPAYKIPQFFDRNSSQRPLRAIQSSVQALRLMKHPHCIPDNSRHAVIDRDYEYEDVMKAPAW